ncbi:MAG: HTTM domain-containing protein [Polyangiaceae bacterium]|nr:HTTM domain-containing protein [Myxococcales bacterium]MCB9589230.1 HTTM domain-containing protein [Polyangiaceae bacterium]
MTDARRCSSRLTAALHQPVAAEWLVVLRFALGTIVTVSALRFIAYGWVEQFFTEPTFHFRYWGLGWVPVVDSAAMHGLFWLTALLGVLVSLGLFFRVSCVALFLCFSYLQLVDVANYLNHYYLVCILTLLLSLSPAGKFASLDVWLGRASPQAQHPRFWLWLFRLQVGIVYTFAALAKANSDWLIHGQPLGIWLSSRTHIPFLGDVFALPGAALVMSWCGFLFDLSVVWLLLYRRTRAPAYIVAVTFHVLTRVLFPIGMFPFIMLAAALVFFPPSAFARIGRWTRERLRRPPSRSARVARVPPALAWGLAVFCLVQLALPLRHWTYGGNVLWHEQGMRFSWRVMAREKNGSVTYVVRTPSGLTQHVSPRNYLTRIQERELATQPDLILQLAHHIAADYEQRGIADVQVHADAWASMNGRPMSRLIDPRVDLARVRDGIGPANWVFAAPATPPLRLRSNTQQRLAAH